jgi:transposase
MTLLSDEMWARVEPLLPPVKGALGRPMREHRYLVGGAIYRYRTGIAWRDRFQVSDRSHLAHRGHHRMTRIHAVEPANPATTPSDAPAAA